MMAGIMIFGFWSVIVSLFIGTVQPKRINPPHRIRCIRIDVQPTRKPDRILAYKPPDLRIIVPIAVVVQSGFGVEVLPLKAQRVADVFAYCAAGTLLFGQPPRLIRPTPGNLAALVGEFHGRAEVVALVPGYGVERFCHGLVLPQRVAVDVVAVFMAWLAHERQAAVFDGLGDGDEAARFVEVVDQTSFARVVAVACFISEGVAVPAVDVLAAVVLGVERALLLLDPRRAGAGAGRAVDFE
ncbi:hypothetical protein TU84_25160, partial [Pseudomonas helleri]